MQFVTKFNPGDKVVYIGQQAVERVIHCRVCDRTGEVVVAGEKFVCPKCSGKSKHRQFAGNKWFVQEPYEGERTIAVVEVKLTHPSCLWSGDKPVMVKYQFGQGNTRYSRIEHEEDMFYTKEEAQAECDRRNAGLDDKDEA